MSGNKLLELPRDFIQLRKLTDLYLCANHLTELPHDFGDLCELQTLTLNGNLLKSLPRSLQNCTKLKNLLVCGNPLKHTPPLFNLGSLRELWVIGLNTGTNTFQEPSLNHFSKSLEVLFADENKFDDIPDVRHIGNLLYLSLSSNRIRALPPRFCELHSLSVLNLSCNRLRMLPEEFCKLTGLRELQSRHPLIGDVRGHGLFLGIELVTDHDTREPAAAQATAVVNAMRQYGVLLSTDGPLHNVIKIKPPMVIDISDINMTLRLLDDALSKQS